MGKTPQITPPVAWAEMFAHWETHLRAAGQTKATVRTRRYPVLRCAVDVKIPPGKVTIHNLEQWLGSRNISPETRHEYRAGLRSFFSFCENSGFIKTNPAAALPEVHRPGSIPLPCPEDAIKTALEASELRVKIMVRLAAEHGLRRGEIAVQRGTDLIETPYGFILKIRGKGGKERLAYIEDDERELIAYYRAAGTGYLFPGRIDGHLSAQHVGKLISAQLPKGYSAHKLRTRFATKIWAEVQDLLELQQLLGHTNPIHTLRYVGLVAEKRRAMTKCARI